MKKVLYVVVIMVGVLLGVSCAPAVTTPKTSPAVSPPPTAAPSPKPSPTASPSPTPSPSSAKVWRFRHNTDGPPGNFVYEHEKWFWEEVARQSAGKLTGEVYGAGALGFKPDQVLPAVADGLVDTTSNYGSSMAGVLPILQVAELPGVLPYDIQLRKKATEIIWPYAEEALLSQNVVLLSATQVPPRNMYARVPIKKLADFKGLKFRSIGPAEDPVVSALGATPVRVSFAEQYSAVQLGTIDGFLSMDSAVVTSKLYEVAKYGYAIGYDGPATFILIGKKTFNSLPADLQQVLLKVGKDFSNKMYDDQVTDNAQATKSLQDKGVQITQADAESLKVIQAAGKTFSEKWAKDSGPKASELLAKLNKLVSEWK